MEWPKYAWSFPDGESYDVSDDAERHTFRLRVHEPTPAELLSRDSVAAVATARWVRWCRRSTRIEIHLIPILFGGGRRLFEHLGIEQRELERISVREGDDGVTNLHYRVRP